MRAYGLAAILAMYDLTAVLAALVLAVMLRFEYLRWEILLEHRASLPIMLAIYLLCLYFFRLYRYRWSFASLDMLLSVLAANALATGLSVLVQWHIDGTRLPLSVIILSGMLATILIGAQRLLMRVATWRYERQHAGVRPVVRDGEQRRVIILGSGQSTVEVLNALSRECAGRYEVIGILDDNPLYQGSFLRGIKILGGLDMLHDLLRQHATDEVIIALPSTDGARLRDCVLACCRHKVSVRVVPLIAELLENPSASRGRLRVFDVSVEDLLHRPEQAVARQETAQAYAGKRILVTGAGGSIGSELCRHLIRVNPDVLVMLGHGENSIVSIQRELTRCYPELATRMVTVISDVRDAARIDAVFTQYQPHIVFHAAAHKHVPVMEENAAEAIKNNIGGTRNIMEAADRHGVERMVLISTDKAVKPSCVMGASKFLCEEMMASIARRSATAFITVRFGNVLGSRGSVLPYFQEQILHGGPVTVTHPEMRRYFMTIPEAALLVLEAGAVGSTGNLYVLDMGRPVRIIDLAENAIRLSGLEPYRDINIEFCGMRPGEKLAEDLFSDAEQQQAHTHGRLYVVERVPSLAPDALATLITSLMEAAARNSDPAVIGMLADALPHFRQAMVQAHLQSAERVTSAEI
jgi:FlaA1/EpsC-like NDP-sugar epimerase